MAYLKLMMDKEELAHLSEDGQYLCANEGVPQYDLPLNLFIGDKRLGNCQTHQRLPNGRPLLAAIQRG